jgi:hypothetical protein
LVVGVAERVEQREAGPHLFPRLAERVAASRRVVRRVGGGVRELAVHDLARSGPLRVDRAGREISVTIAETQTSTTLQKLEIPQAVLEVEDLAVGT